MLPVLQEMQVSQGFRGGIGMHDAGGGRNGAEAGDHADIRHFRMLEDIARELSAAVCFPVCFDLVIEVRKALAAVSSDPDALASVAMLDPLICARLIRRANALNRRRSPGTAPVLDIGTAMKALGHDTTRGIVGLVARGQLLGARHLACFDSFASKLWQHTLRTAAGAAVIARRLTNLCPDTAMTAGLLHDIGAFYMLYRASQYEALRGRPAEVTALILEWHESIGESLLASLRVPEPLIEAMRDHEQPRSLPLLPTTLKDTVFLASVLAGGTSELYPMAVCHVSMRPDLLRAQHADLLEDIEQTYRRLIAAPVRLA